MVRDESWQSYTLCQFYLFMIVVLDFLWVQFLAKYNGKMWTYCV